MSVPSAAPSLEDRVLVALAARGPQRIGQFISNALDRCGRIGPDGLAIHDCAFYVSDEDFVRALEAEAFGGGE